MSSLENINDLEISILIAKKSIYTLKSCNTEWIDNIRVGKIIYHHEEKRKLEVHLKNTAGNCGLLLGSFKFYDDENLDIKSLSKMFEYLFSDLPYKLDFSSILLMLTIKQYDLFFKNNKRFECVLNNPDDDLVIITIQRLKRFYL
jgi:hypothetical protein